jgi:hypothetical protein
MCQKRPATIIITINEPSNIKLPKENKITRENPPSSQHQLT